MNYNIKKSDTSVYPDMEKFHSTPAVAPSKAARILFANFEKYIASENYEIDLRNEQEWKID